jgi:LIVCS family branched-chain amino acid:cation transporter
LSRQGLPLPHTFNVKQAAMTHSTHNGKSLAFKDYLAVSLAVFSLHFGAACMLWPTTWGRDSGTDFALAFAGFVLSGIILPWLGYLAVSKGGGSLHTLTRRVGPVFCIIYGGITVLSLGPLFAVPRMSSASWEAFSHLAALHPASTHWLIPLAFTVAFYLISLWFFHNEKNAIRKLSFLLVPLLLLLEIITIGTAVFFPLGEAVPRNYEQNPVGYGFINGYQTMDLICALMFSGIIIHDLKNRVRNGGRKTNHYLLITSLLGFLVMATVQFGEMYRGSTISGLFPDVDYARLSASIIDAQLGFHGGFIFNLCLILASLTTATGLLSGAASFFSEASGGRLPYKKTALLSFFLALLVSCAGFDFIIAWATPLLQFIYPPCVALVLCYVFLNKYSISMRWSCVTTAVWGALDTASHYCSLAGFQALQTLLGSIPGYDSGLAFIWPMAFGWLLGRLLCWLQHGRFDPVVTDETTSKFADSV